LTAMLGSQTSNPMSRLLNLNQDDNLAPTS